MISIFLLSAFSLYLLLTGAKLKKSDSSSFQRAYFRSQKRKFSFIENYLKSLAFKPDNIYLDINFKDVLKLEDQETML